MDFREQTEFSPVEVGKAPQGVWVLCRAKDTGQYRGREANGATRATGNTAEKQAQAHASEHYACSCASTMLKGVLNQHLSLASRGQLQKGRQSPGDL